MSGPITVNKRTKAFPKTPMFLVTPLFPNHERINPIIEPPIIIGKNSSSGTKSIPLKNKIKHTKSNPQIIIDITLK